MMRGRRTSLFVLALVVLLPVCFSFSNCSSDEEVEDGTSAENTTIEATDSTEVQADTFTVMTDSTEVDEEEDSSSSSDFVEEDDDSTKDFNMTFDYSVLKDLGHPRLLITEDGLEELKTKVTTGRYSNPTLYKMHNMAISIADEALENEEPVSYTNTLDASRNILKRLFNLSYAYRTTGLAKYLNQAVSDLETVCGYSDWHTNWLRISEITMGVAIAYDWLYYDLSYEDRVLAHEKLIKYAVQNSGGANFHSLTGNWNQVCNSCMVAASLTLYEKDKAKCVSAIEKAMSSNPTCMSTTYTPDGNYAAGIDYWTYGTGYEVIMLRNLLMCFGDTGGLAETEGFDKTGEYILFMVGANGENFNYADGGYNQQKSRAASWWLASWLNDPSLIFMELRKIADGAYTGWTDDRILPAMLCFANDLDFESATIEAPSKEFWYGQGEVPVCMIHTGWNFDEDDYYMGFKGGLSNVSHGHQDVGSFIYESQGVRWSYDLVRQGYSVEDLVDAAGGDFSDLSQTSLRWDIYRWNNLAHSTLAFEATDGSVTKVHTTDQLVDGYASFTDVYEDSDYGARLDLSEVYADAVSSVYRTIRLMDGKDLYIIDEVTAKSDLDAPMMWRMLTPATVSVGDSNEVLTKNGKTLYLSASNTAGLDITYTTWDASRPSTWTSRTWDSSNSGYTVAGYTATIPAGTSVTFTTILSAEQ